MLNMQKMYGSDVCLSAEVHIRRLGSRHKYILLYTDLSQKYINSAIPSRTARLVSHMWVLCGSRINLGGLANFGRKTTSRVRLNLYFL